MSERPSISASLLADINDSVASRAMRKLDKDPEAANGWQWSQANDEWAIEAGSETVVLKSDVLTAIEQIQCTCLLAPRCFHILAICNVLPIAEAEPEDVPGEDTASPEDGSIDDEVETADVVDVSDEQRTAAAMMTSAVGNLLSSGLRAAGGGAQSRLLRAIHECRATALHRLSAAGLRVLNHARSLRAGSEDFDADFAVSSLHEVFLVARQVEVSVDGLPLRWLGTARRRYRPVASLKLFGLCCEPVLTASGYAGVVTWMLTDQQRIVSVSDVQPGDAGRIAQAWKTSVSLAGLAMSHRDLSQQKLLVSKATISDDGRVGGSDSARAVPAKHEGWRCPEIEARFAEPLTNQIRRYFNELDAVGQTTTGGAALVFLTGTVCGFDDRFLIFRLSEGGMVRLAISFDTTELPYRENMILLARAPGLSLRCIARLVANQPGHFQLLSIASGPGEESAHGPGAHATAGAVGDGEDASPELQMPEPGAHFDLGLHRLQRSHFTMAERQPVDVSDFLSGVSSATTEPTSSRSSLLHDWLAAIAVGGRHALSGSAVSRLARDAQSLESNFQPTSASALRTLAHQALETQSNMEGIRFPGDATELSTAWLATAIVQSASEQHQQQAVWRSGVEPDS